MTSYEWFLNAIYGRVESKGITNLEFIVLCIPIVLSGLLFLDFKDCEENDG